MLWQTHIVGQCVRSQQFSLSERSSQQAEENLVYATVLGLVNLSFEIAEIREALIQQFISAGLAFYNGKGLFSAAFYRLAV
jgi:hypothetical protein